MIKASGSVRVDLLGGTLDISPMHLIIPKTVTLNFATSLKAKVSIEEIPNKEIIINSLDYQTSMTYQPEDFNETNFNSDFFGPLKFIALIINHFKINSGYKFELSSGSPPGAGLGGSSTMGAVLYKALCQLTETVFDPNKCIAVVRGYESIILNKGPAGYQDYYPAVYGGILALVPQVEQVEVDQLYSEELKEVLENQMTLIYTGETRLSGINNWEVYKGFFDKEQKVIGGLAEIANLADQAYQSIKNQQYSEIISLIGQEGSVRKELFPGIVSPSMDSLYNEIKRELPELSMKVCGAGGGGCFLLLHEKDQREIIEQHVSAHPKMNILELQVEPPL